MSLPHNYQKYEKNIKEPYLYTIDDTEYMIHSFIFTGVQDLYDLLKKDPEINSNAFSKDSPSSKTNPFGFAGIPYDEALEKLIKEMDPGYQEYMSIQKKFQSSMPVTNKYVTMKSIAGGVVDPVAYTTGSPEIYTISRVKQRPKAITINIQVAYCSSTTKEEVFNRALIITSLISALERSGYAVNVNSFMSVEEGKEIINGSFQIKKQGKNINYQTLYKTLVDVDFFRRLCFRLMEISDVKNIIWSTTYGRLCSEEKVRKLLKLKKNDIYFDQPTKMNISGSDIAKDFENVIHTLRLDSIIDVKKEKESLLRSAEESKVKKKTYN